MTTWERCPRCGLPENWTLRLRVRAVIVGFVLAAGLGVLVGRYAFRERDP